ncbi:magnesium-translocating P-type ATPase [Phocea massiliensis]|uniref:Magnesium-transporting ATPase, P-type 1 n=1 Tax=Merdimmobilis hominis TaxID=2897707 RepID=A0A938X9E6_9FIRM|nr:magnesium-translocating P-type ATPase [Merdimmobilis hominis]MBM6921772.1 magnesium-translocating P-type ATPase [Merdimmobilis hominis]
MKSVHSIHERIRQFSVMESAAIAQILSSPAKGLCDKQIEANRVQYGENQMAGNHHDTVWFRLRRAFIHPFSITLFVLAVISLITDVFLVSHVRRNFTTVLIISVMLIVSGGIRFVQEIRSKKIADRLTKLVHDQVLVRRNGTVQAVDSEDLVVGDRVLLRAGDRVPADIRLTSVNDLFVSQSVITGESGVFEKNAAPLSAVPAEPAGFENTVFLGTTVTAGSAEGIVLAVGEDTVYGTTSSMILKRKNGFDRGANSIALVLIRFMAILVPTVFLACGLTKGDWVESFLFALSVAVGLTPELLPMVINACLAKGSANMAKKQTIVKNINAMQGFGSMDVLCVDKTGTLTSDHVQLEYYMDILGNESQKVLDYAMLNSCYHTGVYNHLDEAVMHYKTMPGKEAYFTSLIGRHEKLDELPFDYSRKAVSVLLSDQTTHLLIMKGSVDAVLERCGAVEHQEICYPIGTDASRHVRAVVDEMLEDGMKVLAVAYKPIETDTVTPADERDLILLGYLAFFDAPKQSAVSAMQSLSDLHVDIKVLTGDQKEVACSICRRLGIDTSFVLTGAQLEALSENEMPVCVEKATVFAALSPKQKAQIVQVLQENGHTVGFLGDGMNDLPAVVQADVGISVDTATEALNESADVILLKKDLNVLEEGILEGRKAFVNMLKYVKITASSNFGNICAVVIASILLPFFPMTSVQLLLLNLLYDSLCLILPWDHVDREFYKKPLDWSGRTLGRFMLRFGPISSVFDLLTFAFLFFVLCPAVCGGPFFSLPPESQALFIALFQTGWFLESMWTQISILHLLRTQKLPFLQSRPSLPVVIVTVLGILAFTVLTVTPIGRLMGLCAMPGVYFVFLVGIVLLYLLCVTAAKAIYVKKYRNLL